MSNWQVEDEEMPADYQLLCKDANNDEGKLSFGDMNCNDEDEESPIRGDVSLEPEVVLRVYEKNGVPDKGDDGAFLAPDAHAMFVSPEERVRREKSEKNERRMSGRRGGRRGVRGVQGQSARGRGHPGRGCRASTTQWEVGHPLNEIWTTDKDVPPELVSLATDVVRKRQMRLEDARAERNAERADASESENADEFFDAIDGEDCLPGLERQHFDFEWSPMDESFQSQEENFKPERTGSVHCHSSAYGAFRTYWDDDILGLIVTETNRYATKINSTAFQSSWFPTNIHEILCLFAFWNMLGIIKLPSIHSCFSVNPLLKTEIFRRIFPRSRYDNLTRALHFINSDPAVNAPQPSDNDVASFDPIHCIRPIITHLNSKFQSNYILDKNICIDQSLTLRQGKLGSTMYLYKTARYGMRSYELCESTTGYLWSFIIDARKQTATELEEFPEVLKTSAVVMKLIGPLLNKGYRLFMDNRYNSPLLARYLKLNGTDFVGTLRLSSSHVPVVVTKAPLRRGEYIARHSGDVSILCWQDMRRVTMISTCHGSSTALPRVSSRHNSSQSRPVPFKPQMVLDYNKFMGGVDLMDQMLEPYLLERKRCSKWYMNLFKRFLNVSILNSRILLQSSTQKHQEHLGFRLQLVDSILKEHLPLCPLNLRSAPVRAVPNRSTQQVEHLNLNLNRYIQSIHWPVYLENTPNRAAAKRRNYKRCVACAQEKKKKFTSYCCEACCVPLCVLCFKSYHTAPS